MTVLIVSLYLQWPGFDKIVLILIIIHTILFALKWQGMSLGAEVTVQGSNIRSNSSSLLIRVTLCVCVHVCVCVCGGGGGGGTNAVISRSLRLIMRFIYQNIFLVHCSSENVHSHIICGKNSSPPQMHCIANYFWYNLHVYLQ